MTDRGPLSPAGAETLLPAFREAFNAGEYRAAVEGAPGAGV